LAVLFLALLVAGCSEDQDDPGGIEIVTSSFPDAEQGLSYSHTAAANNGVSPYTWAVTGGSLPPGLSLNTGTGEIGGTPTSQGDFSFTLTVTDAASAEAFKDFTLTVVQPPLTITTERIPPARHSAFYSFPLQHVGGGAVTWTHISGTMPTGLGLTTAGVIQGTVSGSPSPSIFTVQVTDGVETDTQRLGIELDPATMTTNSVRKDGMGDYTTVAGAIAAIPNPQTVPHIIEIADSGLYVENLTLPPTTTGWVMIRSAYDHLPTVQAALPAVSVIDIQRSQVEIKGLIIRGAASAFGISVDSTVNSINVQNCIFIGNNTAFLGGTAVVITFANNTCYGPEGVLSDGGASCVFRNNIIYSHGPFGIHTMTSGLDSDYNHFHATGPHLGIEDTATFLNLAAWQTSSTSPDTNSSEGDPLFVNIAADDFHLQSLSPARDKGTSSAPGLFGLPVTDAQGYARQENSINDMGALEGR